MLKRKETRYGAFEFISNDTCIGRSLDVYGEWVQREIDFLLGLIAEGDVVVDIGANYGTHSVSFADRVGECGRVFSIEAQPYLYELLVRNCEATVRQNTLDLINAVVADEEGEITKPEIDYSLKMNYGAMSFKGGQEQPAARPTKGQDVPIRQMTVDSLALEKCALIKIDVEGMEREVIDGAGDTIRRTRPILFLECNELDEGWDCIKRLDNLGGYACFVYASSPFNPENHSGEARNIFDDYMETNIVAIPLGHRAIDYVRRNTEEIDGLTSYVVALLRPTRAPDQPIEDVKGSIFETYGKVVARLTQQLATTGRALEETKELALRRLQEKKERVHATMEALEEARGIARERLEKNTELHERLQATRAGLQEAKRLAFERLDEIMDLYRQLKAAGETLEGAKRLADECRAEKQQMAKRLARTENDLEEARGLAARLSSKQGQRE